MQHYDIDVRHVFHCQGIDLKYNTTEFSNETVDSNALDSAVESRFNNGRCVA